MMTENGGNDATGAGGADDALWEDMQAWPFGAEAENECRPIVDLQSPSAARIYDFWLGGKDHYGPDREIGDEVAERAPWVAEGVRENRLFLARAVSFLAANGIDQFIDVGSGLPTAPNVHEVAREVIPWARTCYVDHDPLVLVHGRALLADNKNTVVVEGDARDPATLLERLGAHVDWRRPVGLLALAVLHFLSKADDPAATVAAFREVMAPGSYLVISHVTPGQPAQREAMASAVAAYRESGVGFTPRDRDDIRALFEGFELVSPGLVTVDRWRSLRRAEGAEIPMLAGVGRLAWGRSGAPMR